MATMKVGEAHTFEVEGHAVAITRIEALLYSDGSKREKSRYSMTIDGVERAHLVFPFGWGKYPNVRPMKNTGSNSTASFNVYGQADYRWQAAAEKLVKEWKTTPDNWLSTPELQAASAKAREEQARFDEERERRKQESITEGRHLLSVLRVMLDTRSSVLTTVERDALLLAIKRLPLAYPRGITGEPVTQTEAA